APVERLGWLFEEHMPDLPDTRRGEDFTAYGTALAETRAEAAREIANALDWPQLHAFAIATALPWYFGAALAQAGAIECEQEILTLLSSGAPPELDLALGYASQRFFAEGWAWVDAQRDGKQ